MGQAARRRRLRLREWMPLFGDQSPVTAAISRPEYRPETTPDRDHSALLKHRFASGGERAQCFNFQCPAELPKPPEVRMFLKMTKDTKQ